MLYCAYAAAYHWSHVGMPLNGALADVTLAHILARLGRGEMALHYAQRGLDFCQTNRCDDWDVPFAHAGLAHAAAIASDAALHAEHYALAQATGAVIAEDEDRQVFLAELARIPVSRA